MYPLRVGQRRLGLGFAYKLLHDRFGFDFGERYHRDLDFRIETTMEIDRAVFESYGQLGAGHENPTPRVSIEPFGHRFMPAMYGCECGFAADADPWSRPRAMTKAEIDALEPWSPERFERSEPVRLVHSQINRLKERYEDYRRPDEVFNPHYRAMSSLQNLGSVINTAFSVQGQQLLLDYLDDPDSVGRLYANITDLMLLGLDRFAEADGWPLANVFVGNCTVSMISPRQYAALNCAEDRRLMEYARSLGARFMMHQDSNANPHLENYARFDYLHAFDLGQDTDFEKLHRLCPNASVNCILFPAWVSATPMEEIRAELSRLITLGSGFPSFSFSLFDVDTDLGGNRLFEFFETFRQCVREH
jgi:hypothetical protein